MAHAAGVGVHDGGPDGTCYDVARAGSAKTVVVYGFIIVENTAFNAISGQPREV